MSKASPFLHELPYGEPSERLIAALAMRPWAMWLDSGPRSKAGPANQARFDIVVAEPYATLLSRGGSTMLCDQQGCRQSGDDPFDLLRGLLGRPRQRAFSRLPFCGGAVGHFSYDLARRIERLPRRAEDDLQLPEMAIGLYDWALVIDHQQRRSWFVSQGEHPNSREQYESLRQLVGTAPVEGAPLTVSARPHSNLSRARYGEAFRRIQGYLREGDCYQVNLAQRFSVPLDGDPWQAYRQLRRISPGPFGAWLNLPGYQLLSISPERFLQVRNGGVETRPIKGTRPRQAEAEADRHMVEALRNSEKDRAENLMIVDLLRNDIGRSCRAGSVHVPELFAVESYATVHHMVSTVRGQLADGHDCIDLLRGCFPGGSITGAPKLRAMAIIEELEPHRRGVYCGSIGYIGVDGDMDTNIAIRTAVHQDRQLHYWAGGGIVVDSDEEEEYQETLAKAQAFFRLFGQS